MKLSFINNKIKSILLIYFLITTALISAAGLISLVSTSNMLLGIRSLFKENVEMTDMNNRLTENESLLQLYMISNNESIFEDYSNNLENLAILKSMLPTSISSNPNILMQKNIRNMLDKYIELNTKIISDKNSREGVISSYSEIVAYGKNIRFAIEYLLSNESQENAENYYRALENIRKVVYFNITLIIMAIIANILLARRFTNRLSEPLIEISAYANKIAEGNFNVEIKKYDQYEEIQQLADSFNIMITNIKEYINDINEKARIEKEQQLQNIEMQNLLRITQQQALQSQINPHFLYNTLNAGSQLSMLEGAEQTGEFLVTVADLFRYNLSNLDSLVSIETELKHVEMYLFILEKRYPGKIHLVKEIDETLLDFKIPRMILQPLIENAYIHGFANVHYKGIVIISIHIVKEKVEIVVTDNGAGMNEDEIKYQVVEVSNNQSSGIGLANIFQRLKLLYNDNDVLKISSEKNVGTRIKIFIPIVKEG